MKMYLRKGYEGLGIGFKLVNYYATNYALSKEQFKKYCYIVQEKICYFMKIRI